MRRITVVLALLACSVQGALSWEAEPIRALPAAMTQERCERAPNGLPDGCVARGAGDITRAWYEQPTDRYRHTILGDALEAGALAVRTSGGRTLRLALPSDQVFEDRTPRLADLDRDGQLEVITIRASTRQGASVALFGVRNGALVEIASGPFIGRANRWLNIAGIADFLGTGRLQIAYVQTPHIGGILKLLTFDGRSARVVLSQSGYSNHEIRAREMRLSAVADINGDGRPDLALPDTRRQSLELVSLTNARVTRIASVPLPAPVVGPVLIEGSGQNLRFLANLAGGGSVSVRR